MQLKEDRLNAELAVKDQAMQLEKDRLNAELEKASAKLNKDDRTAQR